MQYSGSWKDLDMQCRLETLAGKFTTRLVIIENQRENDCLVKYISDEYHGDPVKTYAIGLKTADTYKGVYEWSRVPRGTNDDMTTRFTNWSPVSPLGKACAAMDLGDSATISGLWRDVDCTTTKMLAICEKVVNAIPEIP